MQNIPEIFKSPDTVFHYCKREVAIENILFEKKLRLSPRKNSIDPLENIHPMFSQGGVYRDLQQSLDIEKRTESDLAKIKKAMKTRIQNTKQLCFCMNDTSDKFKGYMQYPEEYYGFLKPRMWDQYADNYKGICLAFSKSELPIQDHHLEGTIDYVPYSHLHTNHVSIRLAVLDEYGYDEYEKRSFAKLDRSCLRKHADYSGENEFRICSFSENEYDYLDISSAVKGIIVSQNYISEYSRKTLEEIADSLNIELIYITWGNAGLSVTTKDEMQKIYNISLDSK